MKDVEVKLHNARYDMKRIADELFVSYGLLTRLIGDVQEDDPSDPISTKKMLQHVANEIASYSTELNDCAK